MPGAAKAWVNFNGTGTVAIRAQFNVTSITDNGTGDYTVNFTTAFANANYAATFGRNIAETNVSPCFGENSDNPLRTTTALRVINRQGATGKADGEFLSVAVLL